MMHLLSIEEVQRRVVKDLDILSGAVGTKVYKGVQCVHQYTMDGGRGDVGRLSLKNAFSDYITDMARAAAGDYLEKDGVIHDIFKTGFGTFFVCAFTSLDMELGVSFCYSREDPSDVCVLGEYKQGGPKRQCMYVSGVPLRLRAHCSQPLKKSYKCSRCSEAGLHARYCGKECQRMHWPTHRAVCGGVGSE